VQSLHKIKTTPQSIGGSSEGVINQVKEEFEDICTTISKQVARILFLELHPLFLSFQSNFIESHGKGSSVAMKVIECLTKTISKLAKNAYNYITLKV
jgi:hypothetical protein